MQPSHLSPEVHSNLLLALDVQNHEDGEEEWEGTGLSMDICPAPPEFTMSSALLSTLNRDVFQTSPKALYHFLLMNGLKHVFWWDGACL